MIEGIEQILVIAKERIAHSAGGIHRPGPLKALQDLLIVPAKGIPDDDLALAKMPDRPLDQGRQRPAAEYGIVQTDPHVASALRDDLVQRDPRRDRADLNAIGVGAVSTQSRSLR